MALDYLPAVLQPSPFQIRGVGFLLGSGSLLADPPGLGKTLQGATAAVNVYMAVDGRRRQKPILVACPAAAVGVWTTEFSRQYPFLKCVYLHTGNIGPALRDQPDVIIISFGAAALNGVVMDTLRELRFSYMLVDESHYLKNPDKSRTQSLICGDYALCNRADVLKLMTGTPTPRDVTELWTSLRATSWHRIDSMEAEAFAAMYANRKLSRIPGTNKRVLKVVGNNSYTIPDLKARLAAREGGGEPWWIARPKSVALAELPPKRRRVVPLQIGSMKLPDEVSGGKEAEAIRAAIVAGDMGMLGELEDDEVGFHISRLRRVLAEAKAEAAALYAQMVVDGGEATIAWFQHTSGMDAFAGHLNRLKLPFVRIDGSIPPMRRKALEEQFQSPDGPMIMLGQMEAAGVALTMTKATRVLMIEPSGVPGRNVQAEDRAWRRGQRNSVCVDYLAIEGSIDEGLMALAERRAAQTEDLMESAAEEVGG